MGLQYVLDGMELINKTANDLSYAACAVTQGLVANLEVSDLQVYVQNPSGKYPEQRVKAVLRAVMALLKEL